MRSLDRPAALTVVMGTDGKIKFAGGDGNRCARHSNQGIELCVG